MTNASHLTQKIADIQKGELNHKNVTAAIKRHKKQILLPYPCSDGKTVFYCTTPEKGLRAVKNYEKKLRTFK